MLLNMCLRNYIADSFIGEIRTLEEYGEYVDMESESIGMKIVGSMGILWKVWGL